MVILQTAILVALIAWLIPLVLFVFYTVTEPVPGKRLARRWFPLRELEPPTRVILAQKLSFILVISFILLSRAIGDFPGRHWVALGLYLTLPAVAWVVHIYQRRVQLPEERRARRRN